jgi:hypothetical protein
MEKVRRTSPPFIRVRRKMEKVQWISPPFIRRGGAKRRGGFAVPPDERVHSKCTPAGCAPEGGGVVWI